MITANSQHPGLRLPHHARGPRVDSRGAALALALICVTVVGMLGAGYLQITSALVRRQSVAVDQQLAFYLAEAGLAESFQAVRMGRSGQIGSVAAPAVYGQGLVWVDVLELVDGSLRLDSTGLKGAGRSSLSLVVQPVELKLGFFADSDLVVDTAIMADGWDSDESTYEALVEKVDIVGLPTRELLMEHSTHIYNIVGPTTYGQILEGPDIDPMAAYSGDLARLSQWELERVALFQPALRLAYPHGYDPAGPVAGYGETSDDSSVEPEIAADEGPLGEPCVTTEEGALIGSNGNVTFNLPEGEKGQIWGDVVPGPLGTVSGTDSVDVVGETSSRPTAVELPDVELPVVALAPAVRHDDLFPMLITVGTSGHERIEVAADAELVIRGPATVVVGELVLEPGALLTLDTRAGEIALFVLKELDLQPGSSVSNSGDQPDETTVQVSSAVNDPSDPAVKLEATSQFYGTIYAPKTGVRIGSEFEIFGAVVAGSLEISANARLHFDSSGFGSSALPKIIGWRLIEVPAAVKQGGDPFRLLGLTAADVPVLADSHDLAAVAMELEYVDLAGVKRSYSGAESLFDWETAASVVSVERTATREKEAGADDPEETGPEEAGPATPARANVDALLSSGEHPHSIADDLVPFAPYSPEEWAQIYDIDPGPAHTGMLRDADLAAGGTGG